MSVRVFSIYALRDPRDRAIRYVGLTSTPLRVRHAGHCLDACARVRSWIRDLAEVGKKPLIELLARFDGTRIEARGAEVAWMDLVEAKFGARLLNVYREPPGGKKLTAAIAMGVARRIS